MLFLDQLSQKAESGGRPALLEPLDLLEQLGEHYKPIIEIRSLLRFKIEIFRFDANNKNNVSRLSRFFITMVACVLSITFCSQTRTGLKILQLRFFQLIINCQFIGSI